MADDLDQLLDSALDDFSKIDLASAQRSGGGPASASAPAPDTASSSGQVQGLGMGLPDLKPKKGKQRAALPSPMRTGSSHASEALEKLTQRTREAVRGLEAATAAAGARGDGEGGESLDYEEEGMQELIKQFERLAGTQGIESMVENMMHQLLSKEILYEPMKEIGERYPKWLEEHKSSLSQEEYERYHRQNELILKLIDVYQYDPDNFTKIVDLMQKMQECGQPPNDIVQELAPDFDLSNLGGELSPELLESASNCCIT